MSAHKPHLLVRIALLLSALLGCVAPAGSQELKPFTARYQAKFHGLSGGILELTLRKGAAPGEYVYESRAEPSFLGSFMISSSARERTVMIIDDTGVRPLSFFSDDGKSGDEKDSNLVFDWQRKRLSGRSEQVSFDRELPLRTQDHLSIQVAVLYALQSGGDLGEFSLVDAGEVKQYTYSNEGPATAKYQGRAFDAVIVRSERTGSSRPRINRYWHAPALHHVPVHAERSRDGKVDLTMDLIDVQFPD